jgi:Flp pilus assembly protein TadG
MKRFGAAEKGLTSVEFAVVGLLFFVVLFGVFEVSRAFYYFNALDEVTRRGARMAAVCVVNDPAIAEVAVFNASGGPAASGLIPGLTTANVQVDYLNRDGVVIGDPVTNFGNIDYVQVSIVNFQHQLIIPTNFITITSPDFRTVLPRESLGVSREGFTPC